jgi:hypothetical protein
MDVANVLDGIRFVSWFGPEMDEPVNPLRVQRQALVEDQFDVVAVEPMMISCTSLASPVSREP